MKLDPAELNVYFLDGAKPIFTENFRKGIEAELEVIGPISLLIVDTSVAYFTGDDENSNTQLGNHARMLRSLCTLNGKPTVLVTCHPIKNADANNLIPRGGGAFLTRWMATWSQSERRDHSSSRSTGTASGEGRNQPVLLQDRAIDQREAEGQQGRLVWTVYAEPVGEAEKAVMEEASRDKSLELLAAMVKHPDASLNTLAEALGWVTSSGEINKSLVRRLMLTLQNDKKVKKDHNRWSITPKGKKSVTEAPQRKRKHFDRLEVFGIDRFTGEMIVKRFRVLLMCFWSGFDQTQVGRKVKRFVKRTVKRFLEKLLHPKGVSDRFTTVSFRFTAQEEGGAKAPLPG